MFSERPIHHPSWRGAPACRIDCSCHGSSPTLSRSLYHFCHRNRRTLNSRSWEVPMLGSVWEVRLIAQQRQYPSPRPAISMLEYFTTCRPRPFMRSSLHNRKCQYKAVLEHCQNIPQAKTAWPKVSVCLWCSGGPDRTVRDRSSWRITTTARCMLAPLTQAQ